MGLELRGITHTFADEVVSPSHTVGLELKQEREKIFGCKTVTIPHGGLGTNFTIIFEDGQNDLSPSHTVGLEPVIFLCF